MPTLSDVAARAGVSISVASRVLSGASSARARPETRERIRVAARDLGYRPNFAGRALKLARSNVIALVVPDLTNAIFSDLMTGVEDAAADHDYIVLLGRAEDLRPGGQTIERLVGEGRVDGILMQARDEVDSSEYLIDSRAPVVLINAAREGLAGAVTLDDEAGARLGVEHLIGLGHRRIGLVNGRPATDTAGRREAGFRRAMTDAGIAVDPAHVTRAGYDSAAGRRAFGKLVESGDPPTAVFVANVNAAIGMLGEARARDLRVPEDISIVAMHDAWTAENSWPPLTTVRMPLYELGQRAVHVLHDALSGRVSGPVRVDTPAPALIQRESTRPL